MTYTLILTPWKLRQKSIKTSRVACATKQDYNFKNDNKEMNYISLEAYSMTDILYLQQRFVEN